MKLSCTFAIVVLAASLAAIPCSAQTYRYFHEESTKLVEYWRSYKRIQALDPQTDRPSTTDVVMANQYGGYVIGVVDAIESTGTRVMPEGVKNASQVNEVVGKWLEKNPEQWHRPAPVLILTAIKQWREATD